MFKLIRYYRGEPCKYCIMVFGPDIQLHFLNEADFVKHIVSVHQRLFNERNGVVGRLVLHHASVPEAAGKLLDEETEPE